MVIYNFKHNSILNTTLARVINGIVLSVLLLLWFCTTFHWNIRAINGSAIAIMIAYVLLSTINSIEVILRKNKWCVIDKKESERKQNFIIYYCCLSFFFTTLIAIATALAIRCVYYHDAQGILWYIGIIAYLVFNRFNICSLFKLENSLPLYDCSDLDMIKHVLARDYHMNLDELLWELRRYKGLEK